MAIARSGPAVQPVSAAEREEARDQSSINQVQAADQGADRVTTNTPAM